MCVRRFCYACTCVRCFPDARLFRPETELFAKELPPSNLNTLRLCSQLKPMMPNV